MGLIECVFAYVLPRESSSSSTVERVLAIAWLANAEGIELPPTKKP